MVSHYKLNQTQGQKCFSVQFQKAQLRIQDLFPNERKEKPNIQKVLDFSIPGMYAQCSNYFTLK